ncbi:MAG: hypothetical protein EA367_19045 [Leptolyngbya sp. DLM2.Bin15]|nr:MAG: hypothetical protein EA367_19045 [Leptolyngbya sp. DLM2.Bin15]
MIDSEALKKLQNTSIEERIFIIEMILQSLRNDVSTSSQPAPAADLQRPAFGFMKDTGTILGDVIAPILPETAWDVLQ